MITAHSLIPLRPRPGPTCGVNPTVVPYGQIELSVIDPKLDTGHADGRMFDEVVERFLRDAIEVDRRFV